MTNNSIKKETEVKSRFEVYEFKILIIWITEFYINNLYIFNKLLQININLEKKGNHTFYVTKIFMSTQRKWKETYESKYFLW